ncbi:MAG TPA: pyridoxal phosphate-dependent aminotransferase [Steroidobacteraceae bacterium]|nr:pyridoxal phosphate-dependent aminotransferase [Steroidobacteraceae bacterium]
MTAEAAKLGYSQTSPDWCNLGQGQPEAGALLGAPSRCGSVEIDVRDLEYAPVPGLWELRESIADLYNRRYRRGLPSKYTADNVSVSGGGRSALTRAAASLGRVNLGHFLPDYTAYEELLDIFKAFTAIPIVLEPERDYVFSQQDLLREIRDRGLSALLLSNPNNPTGKLIRGSELASWVEIARAQECTLMLDEFYSHYIWTEEHGRGAYESAARYVDDVDADPVVIFDGLTKNWRLPGWRITWTVAPRSVIESVASAGSFLDGGGCKPLQRAAIALLDEDSAEAEASAIAQAFGAKRALLLARLPKMGVRVESAPEGTFYVWGDLSALPAPLNEGMGFFRAALRQKVIVVPGEFFDVNPGKRRGSFPSRFRRHARFSFGPEMDTLCKACDRLEEMTRQIQTGYGGRAACEGLA